jgi:hypothetical protein
MPRRKYNPEEVVEKTKDQGFTVQPDTGDVPTSGTMVSIPGHEQPVPIDELTSQKVESFVENPSRSHLFSNPSMYLGTWRSSDYGFDAGVLDVSKNFKDTPEGSRQARSAAMSGDQWAIWNLDRGVPEVNLAKPEVRQKVLGHGIEIGETPEEYVASDAPVGTHVSYGYLTKPRYSYRNGRRALEGGVGQGMFIFPGMVENIDETEAKRQENLKTQRSNATAQRKERQEKKKATEGASMPTLF